MRELVMRQKKEGLLDALHWAVRHQTLAEECSVVLGDIFAKGPV